MGWPNWPEIGGRIQPKWVADLIRNGWPNSTEIPNHRRRAKKRIITRPPQPLEVPARPNAVWSLDFMHDTLYVGRCFRTLNVMDEGVRELLAIEVDTSLPGEHVVRVLDQIKSWRGTPEAIRCDNGPEFLCEAFRSWCEENACHWADRKISTITRKQTNDLPRLRL
jgi:transposase InsO family protein